MATVPPSRFADDQPRRFRALEHLHRLHYPFECCFSGKTHWIESRLFDIEFLEGLLPQRLTEN